MFFSKAGVLGIIRETNRRYILFLFYFRLHYNFPHIFKFYFSHKDSYHEELAHMIFGGRQFPNSAVGKLKRPRRASGESSSPS